MCVDGDLAALSLVTVVEPESTFHPSLLEGDLTLSLEDTNSEVTGTVTTSALPSLSQSASNAGNTSGAVVWNVSAISVNDLEWTVFPATGLLLPGTR